MSTQIIPFCYRISIVACLSKSDPNKSFDIWVHGLGMKKVYFQIGMIIGDTEEHNKICGFRGGNGWIISTICLS